MLFWSAFNARSTDSFQQVVIGSGELSAAFTQANTARVSVRFASWSFLDHKKLAESLSDDGLSFSWHNIADSLLCFRGGSGCRSLDPLRLQYEPLDSVFKG
jgi:hypothetical protein